MSAAIPAKRAEVHQHARARHCALAVHPGQNEGEPVHLRWLVSGSRQETLRAPPNLIVRSPMAA
jgi:hypothetical protein